MNLTAVRSISLIVGPEALTKAWKEYVSSEEFYQYPVQAIGIFDQKYFGCQFWRKIVNF